MWIGILSDWVTAYAEPESHSWGTVRPVSEDEQAVAGKLPVEDARTWKMTVHPDLCCLLLSELKSLLRELLIAKHIAGKGQRETPCFTWA